MLKFCEMCGAEYKTKPSHAGRRKYCSRLCFEKAHKDNMSGEKNPSFKHGDACRQGLTTEYWTWRHIISRCDDPSNKSYHRYGGRGIGVCSRWRNFDNFLADMGRKPSPEYQIERKDNDGGYEPLNCVWATVTEQSRNKSTNIRISREGVTLCLKDWSLRTGIPYTTLYKRIKSGWGTERAFNTPIRGKTCLTEA
jgi:hypothetical protein